MRILGTQTTEDDPIRVILRKQHGTECEIMRQEMRMQTAEFAAFAPRCTLYSYLRPSNGERLWLIEVERFTPPDVQWWQSWVVDAEPSEAQIYQIVGDDLQTGSVL